ncbi:molybdopterin cofactor-binding domain-containing protein [Undibacterium arcticum]
MIPPMHLQRGDVKQAFARSPHRVKGEWYVGGQEQFYLEGQISYAVPKEDNGMLVLCSTQHPTEMQHVIAHALGVHSHHILVECRRMGGGFGGKESQSALWAALAAISAAHLKRPVKLRADRDDDMLVTGKRHCFHYEYEVGYDDQGRIIAAKVEMVSRAGFFRPICRRRSPPVQCATLTILITWEMSTSSHCAAKTNTQSNTAFRGFGGPQGAIAIEYIVDEIARNLGKDALDVRKINFYGRNDEEGRNVTQYGQKVVDNVIHELVAELEESSEYRQRRAAVQAFNASSPVLKKRFVADTGQVWYRV